MKGKFTKKNTVRQSDRNVLTESRLLKAASSEFTEQGYYSTNVDTITQKADMSHGTFYLYFKNKDDVLIRLIQKAVDEMPLLQDNNIHGKWLNSKSLNEFEQPIIDTIEALAKSSGLLKAFVQGLLQSAEIFGLFTRIIQQLTEIFKTKILSLQNKGKIRDCDANILSQIMANSLLMSIFVWSMGFIACSPRSLAKNISYILFSVIRFDEKMVKTSLIERTTREPSVGIFHKTRKIILEAAKQEFIQHGYFDTQVGDIAKKIGCSRGTFYKYFKSKDELIQAIFENTFNPLAVLGPEEHGFISNFETSCFADSVKISSIALGILEDQGPLNVAFLQGSFYSKNLGKNYEYLFKGFGELVGKKIDELKGKGLCQGVDSLVAAQIILATITYSIFLRVYSKNILHCPKSKFAFNMGTFLYHFANFVS